MGATTLSWPTHPASSRCAGALAVGWHCCVTHCGSAEQGCSLPPQHPATAQALSDTVELFAVAACAPLCPTVIPMCPPQTWSCWMVAGPRQGQPDAAGAPAIAHALCHWMGDALDTIRIPAKCAARLGQCFSTTVDAARVEGRQLLRLPDVERNRYCFSDGVGCISPGE